AHSMGAYVTQWTLQTPEVFPLGHVLLAAADVDRSTYTVGSSFLTNLLSHCTDLTVYWSQQDQALTEPQKLPINQGAVPLGLQGSPSGLPDGCYSIDGPGYYNSTGAPTAPRGFPPDDFPHVWYLLSAPPPPPPPAVNDFYIDFGAVLQGAKTFP